MTASFIKMFGDKFVTDELKSNLIKRGCCVKHVMKYLSHI